MQDLRNTLLRHLEEEIYINKGQLPELYRLTQLDHGEDMRQISEKAQREYREYARKDFKDDASDGFKSNYDARKQQLLVFARDKKKEAEAAEAYQTFIQSGGQSEPGTFCLGHGKWDVYSSVYAGYCWVDRAYSDLQAIVFVTMNPHNLENNSHNPPPPPRAFNFGPEDFRAIFTLPPKDFHFDIFTAPTSLSESWHSVKALDEDGRRITVKFQFYHQNYLKVLVPRYVLFRHSEPPKTAPTFFEFTAVREGSDKALSTQNQSEQSHSKAQRNKSKKDGTSAVRSSTRHTRSHTINQV
ncbi:hypothetical protein N7540_000569 [Penicillium herquei]|nr:hypothetical protein N7540_000569 [Penicillium herquei]